MRWQGKEHQWSVTGLLFGLVAGEVVGCGLGDVALLKNV